MSEELTKELESHVLSISDAKVDKMQLHNFSENTSIDGFAKIPAPPTNKTVRFWSENKQQEKKTEEPADFGSRMTAPAMQIENVKERR